MRIQLKKAGASTFSLFCALAMLFASGCVRTTVTTRHVKPAKENTVAIAVAPFENLTNHRQAGLVMTDLASTILYTNGHVRVIEVSSLQEEKDAKLRRLEIVPWENQLGINTANALVAAKNVKADYVLAGSVGEYGFVDGFGETANVGITLRLVRVSDETVVWAGSESSRRGSVAFSQESVHRLAHKVLRSLLNRMNSETFANNGAEQN